MIRTYFLIPLAALSLLAQGPRGPQQPTAPNRTGSGIDIAKARTITGTVSAVSIAYGAQYPTITVGQNVIKVAPVWYFEDQDFELKAGDPVSVFAAPSFTAGDPYWYAIEIVNTQTQDRIVLRSAAGVPLWTGGPGAWRTATRGGGGGGGIDPASIATVMGRVEKVTAGLGIQMPALVLKLADGQLLTLKTGPERILLAADLELSVGATITAKYGKLICTGEYVALTLTDASGVTVVLRNDDGTPAWN
jgi:molybdopterin converting factor small subunit